MVQKHQVPGHPKKRYEKNEKNPTKITQLLALPRHDTNPARRKPNIIPPKHARRIRQHLIPRKEPPGAQRYPPSKRAHHLRVGWFPPRQDGLEEPRGVKSVGVGAEVVRGVVLGVGGEEEVASLFEGITADGCGVVVLGGGNDAVGRGVGM